ncbi:MAG: hypothetical protein ACYCSS_04300 [Sulfuriferula sp.]
MKKYSLFFILWMSLFAASAQATAVSVQLNTTQVYLNAHEDWTLQDRQAVFIKSKATTPVRNIAKSAHEYFLIALNDNNVQNGNSARNKDNRTYVTYTKTNPDTNKVYTGRTSGFSSPDKILTTMDINHHMNAQGFGPAKMDRYSNNKYMIRSREKQLIKANQAANRHARSTDGISQQYYGHESQR